MVYLEDIIVKSKIVEEHQDSLDTVHYLLQNPELTTKLKKCFFMNESIENLGHIVKAKECPVSPKSIDALN